MRNTAARGLHASSHMPPWLQRHVVARAIHIRGSLHALARWLAVEPVAVEGWMRGHVLPPEAALSAMVDLIVTSEFPAPLHDRRKNPRGSGAGGPSA
jgi:hypothetical protein